MYVYACEWPLNAKAPYPTFEWKELSVRIRRRKKKK